MFGLRSRRFGEEGEDTLIRVDAERAREVGRVLCIFSGVASSSRT